jgi:hypothetical protein
MATRVSLAVKTLFKKYPMASNAVVYGTLITGAEFTQQTITKKILVSYKLSQFHNPSFMNTYTHYIISHYHGSPTGKGKTFATEKNNFYFCLFKCVSL